jgi:phosphoribosyl-ATP pyrophosphohydrolase
MALQQVLPLVIRTADGGIIDVSLMNEKAYTKSLERKELWHLHRDTGRVLPYGEQIILTALKSQSNWYEASVREETGGSSGLGEGTAEPVAEEPSEQPAALRYGAPSEGPGEEERQALGCGSALELLEQTILERKRSMPEGSYTTHLFTSGGEKIRKKTGEEAVELLLAREQGHLISESADLIYHLLVLLAFYDIPVSSVCAELARRGGSQEESR